MPYPLKKTDWYGEFDGMNHQLLTGAPVGRKDLGEVLEPKPGPQEAPRDPKTAKNQPCKIQEIKY